MKFLAKSPLVLALGAVFQPRRHRFRQCGQTVILVIGLCGTASAAYSQAPAASEPASQPAQAQQASQPAETPAQAAPAAATPTTTANPAPDSSAKKDQSGEITEDELKQQLVGKEFFLRDGYLGDSLSFTEHGQPIGHPTPGPYTLSAVQIDKVRLTKRKVELEGSRYALHFLGALPYEDPSKAVDRVKITPKKKVLKITIDREQVIKEKKDKESAKSKGLSKKIQAKAESPKDLASQPVASSETDVATAPATTTATPAPAAASQPEPAAEPAVDSSGGKTGDKTEEKAADEASVTRTISPAHAAQVLREALDRIFAPGLDSRVKAQMPDFWQLYYQAQAAGVDYRPHDPAVLRSSAVDQQAKVLTSIAPDSNEYAQASGIAGRALYRAVIGADGKPGEIAVVRPIGFGLDENAVAAIRKATFQPALKGGQPVAETLDLAVLFRIYSKRTSVAASGDAKPGEPIKPGPYSVNDQPTSNPKP